MKTILLAVLLGFVAFSFHTRAADCSDCYWKGEKIFKPVSPTPTPTPKG
jgi:hypothetical protein